MSLMVGRVQLNEAPMRPFSEVWDGRRKVSLSGVVFGGPGLQYSLANIYELHDNLVGLNGLMPVSFGVKSHRDAFYWVEAAQSALIELDDQDVIRCEWGVDLVRAGSTAEVDLESRFAGPTARLNDHSVTGQRFHAPSGAHTAYYAGSSTPGTVTRTGEDGAVKTYLNLGVTVIPRWECPTTGYGVGRVRFTGITERAGIMCTPSTTWTLSNSLIEVSPVVAGGFAIRMNKAGVWSTPKNYNITDGGTPLGVPVSVGVLYNDYERVTLRVLWNRSPSGRITADLTIRRGSRFVELLVRSNASTTLGVVRATNEAATSATGFIRATSNDSDGHRYVIGSTRTFTGDLTAGGISKASITRFDAFVGAEIDGSSAVAADQAAQLLVQYLGVASETVVAVKR